MSSIITCNGKEVWKYDAGIDDSFLGLSSISSATGQGKTLPVVFDPESTNEYGEFAWKEVDPSKGDSVEGEVLIIEPNEIAKLKEYVEFNSPKSSFWKKLSGNTEEPVSLVEIISSTLNHLSSDKPNQVVMVWG